MKDSIETEEEEEKEKEEEEEEEVSEPVNQENIMTTRTN